MNFKAEMNSDIPLETPAIFCLANLDLTQGIISEYIMIDFICTLFSFFVFYILLTLYSQQTFLLVKQQNDANIYDKNTRQIILLHLPRDTCKFE